MKILPLFTHPNAVILELFIFIKSPQLAFIFILTNHELIENSLRKM